MFKYLFIAITLLLLTSFSNAQSGAHPAKRPQDWWQADWKKDSHCRESV